MNMKNRLILKPGREKSLLRHNLWVFSGAVEQPPEAANGETVQMFSHDGRFLAQAAWSRHSQICARVWSFRPDEAVDAAFFRAKIRAASTLRRAAGFDGISTTGYRLIAAEGDGLSGVVADLYGDFCAVQFLSSGAEYMRDNLIAALQAELPQLRGIYERSDMAVRAKEGLAERAGLLAGEMPPALVEFKENGLRFVADLKNGHKTGFYFDQRENRRLAGSFARGKRVLNLFSYTGGFGVSAAAGGAAAVENVDSSASALALAERNMALNGVDRGKFTNTEANVFELLRQYERENRTFDLIVLDPPKLVDAKSHLIKGCRAYKELALRAFKLLENNGILFTFSCSGLVDASLFAKLTFDAAQDAGCEGAIIRRLAQDADHPVRLNHPETSYLKGLQVVKIS